MISLKRFKFVANKLGLSENELEEIFNGKNKTFRNYKQKMDY